MKFGVFLLALVLFAGCTFPPSYETTVKVHKVNGIITQVEVRLIGNTVTLNDKRHIEAMITSLETAVIDLKNASDQMEVVEPKPTSGGIK